MNNKIFTKKHSPSFYVGVIMILLVVVMAVMGLVRTPYNASELNISLKNQGPSWAHWFGCDNFGRDVLSRVMEGTSTSVMIAVCVVIIGAGIGTAIGAITGFYGGWLDIVLMRLNDSLSSFPTVLLAMVIVAVVGGGRKNLIIALGIVFIPSFVRVVRAEVKVQKELDYVKNATLMGASKLRIIFLDILPNIKTTIIASLLIGFQNAVLSEAGLSYLGLGVSPTDPSLGHMLSEAQSYLLFAPWYAIAPGLTIFILTLGLGLVSHSIKK